MADYVTEHVLGLIESDGLVAGDRLPSVQALASELAVAAPTVRESLRRLQAIGAIELRHGSGIYVRDPRRRVLIANPYPGPLEGQAILDLLEARHLIEPYLAGLTASVATDGELAQLGDGLEGAGRLLRGQDEALHRLNMDFHRGVARFSRSAVLAQTVDSIVDVYGAEQMVIMQLYNDRLRDHEEHLAIYESLCARDPERSSELMRLHIEGIQLVLADRLGLAEPERGHVVEPGAAEGAAS